mmetsp:Transcript_28191/g.77624  ORF Transcript_28191/g.77624 Transcript_28191/m.77624 type:complete len:324 (-) Transcript_28191:583-1554(-)
MFQFLHMLLSSFLETRPSLLSSIFKNASCMLWKRSAISTSMETFLITGWPSSIPPLRTSPSFRSSFTTRLGKCTAMAASGSSQNACLPKHTTTGGPTLPLQPLACSTVIYSFVLSKSKASNATPALARSDITAFVFLQSLRPYTTTSACGSSPTACGSCRTSTSSSKWTDALRVRPPPPALPPPPRVLPSPADSTGLCVLSILCMQAPSASCAESCASRSCDAASASLKEAFSSSSSLTRAWSAAFSDASSEEMDLAARLPEPAGVACGESSASVPGPSSRTLALLAEPPPVLHERLAVTSLRAMRPRAVAWIFVAAPTCASL